MNLNDDGLGTPPAHRHTLPPAPLLSRRDVFSRIGGGFGALGLAQVLESAGGRARAAASEGKEQTVPHDPLAAKPSHFPARASV